MRVFNTFAMSDREDDDGAESALSTASPESEDAEDASDLDGATEGPEDASETADDTESDWETGDDVVESDSDDAILVILSPNLTDVVAALKLAVSGRTHGEKGPRSCSRTTTSTRATRTTKTTRRIATASMVWGDGAQGSPVRKRKEGVAVADWDSVPHDAAAASRGGCCVLCLDRTTCTLVPCARQTEKEGRTLLDLGGAWDTFQPGPDSERRTRA